MKNPLWEGVKEGCGTCEFGRARKWGVAPNLRTSVDCWRFPPTLLVVTVNNQGGANYEEVEAHRPTMAEEDWCGEYKRAGTRDPIPDPR